MLVETCCRLDQLAPIPQNATNPRTWRYLCAGQLPVAAASVAAAATVVVVIGMAAVAAAAAAAAAGWQRWVRRRISVVFQFCLICRAFVVHCVKGQIPLP